jgi:hypothetical protein
VNVPSWRLPLSRLRMLWAHSLVGYLSLAWKKPAGIVGYNMKAVNQEGDTARSDLVKG